MTDGIGKRSGGRMRRTGGRAARVTGRQEHWRGVLEAWAASGLSQAGFCRQRRLPTWKFSWWKRRLTDHGLWPTARSSTSVAGTTGSSSSPFKEGSLPAFWTEYEALRDLQPENRRVETPAEGVRQTFAWVNELPYTDTEGRTFRLGALECREELRGVSTWFAWLTNLSVEPDTVATLGNRGGRLRWTIENEGFNIQKNGGFALEHAYGNGPWAIKNFYLLMQLAHLILQLVERGNRLVGRCQTLFGSLRALGRRLSGIFPQGRRGSRFSTALLAKRNPISRRPVWSRRLAALASSTRPAPMGTFGMTFFNIQECGMPGDAPKVTAICRDESLTAAIRAADKKGRLKAVVVNPDRPVYEYDPMLLVHVPKFLDLRPAPRSRNLIAHMAAQVELDVKKGRAAVEGSYFEEPLPGQTANLRDAIRVGGALGVAFLEVFSFDAAVRELRGETPLGEPYDSLMNHRAYAHEMLEGLLPIWQPRTPGFTHRTQDPPDTAAQVASGAEKWMPAFLPDFADSIGARVEAHDPNLNGRCDAATRSVEAATALLYSHTQTTGPCRAGGPVPVRIVPLLVNAVGDWLACAALIGKGAVLVLPACRDLRAKAKCVLLLAERWPLIREWLAALVAQVPRETQAIARATPETSPAKTVGAQAGLHPAGDRVGLLQEEARTGQEEPVNCFRPCGHFWQVRYGKETGQLEDSKGMQRLHMLLRHRNYPTPVSALALLGMNEDVGQLQHTFQPVLDPIAKEEFRRSLADLDSQIAEAERNNDYTTASHLKEKRGGVVANLSQAAGLGGRDRRLGPKPPP